MRATWSAFCWGCGRVATRARRAAATIESLSPEKRALLLERLRKRKVVR